MGDDWIQGGGNDTMERVQNLQRQFQGVGTRYNVRHSKIPFNVDISDFGTDGKTFSVDFQLGQFDLPGPCELYLDQFLTYNSLTSDKPDNMAFCLHFKDLTIRAHTASDSNGNTINNKMIIPNEHKSVANNHSLVIHKGKKLNYICDIENLQSFPHPVEGTITNLAGKPIFHSNKDSSEGVRKFTYALTGIDASNFTTTSGFPIQSGDAFTLSQTSGSAFTITGTPNGSFLASHFDNSTTLHFSTDTAISLDRTKPGILKFNMGSNSIVLDHDPATNNPNLMLIGDGDVQGKARFIAEFVIIRK